MEKEIPKYLIKEFERLKNKFPSVKFFNYGEAAFIEIVDFKLPSGYNQKTTKLVVRLPHGYPVSVPAYFFVDTSLKKINGDPINEIWTPQLAREQGKPMLLCLVKPHSWNPNRHDMYIYVKFVEMCLQQILEIK